MRKKGIADEILWTLIGLIMFLVLFIMLIFIYKKNFFPEAP